MEYYDQTVKCIDRFSEDSRNSTMEKGTRSEQRYFCIKY